MNNNDRGTENLKKMYDNLSYFAVIHSLAIFYPRGRLWGLG